MMGYWMEMYYFIKILTGGIFVGGIFGLAIFLGIHEYRDHRRKQKYLNGRK